MKFKRLEIPEVVLCEPILLNDNRGYFTEIYRKEKLDKFLGYSVDFCQYNQSKSTYGVLRGLHYQLAPYAQTKLVRVVYGSILDVAVDIRKNSPTFGKHVIINLSSENKKMLLVPKGFAHGFLVLSDHATIAYSLDNYYQPEYERGISYNDESLNINWGINFEHIKISKKDSLLPNIENAEFYDSNIDINE